ncbi:MAG: ATP-dependent DNA ligase, partial [Flavobacteriales bacterium]
MKRFAELFLALDQTTKTTAKIDALVSYFREADDGDKLWCIALLGGKRPKRTIKTSDLRLWCSELAEIPLWLLEDTYHIVGDLAETIALLLPEHGNSHHQSLSAWMEEIQLQKTAEETEKKEWITSSWMKLDASQRFVFNKLITGGFRIGVSQKNVTKALAKYLGKDANEIAHRLMGNWTPQSTTFQELILSESESDDYSKPYPFYLA